MLRTARFAGSWYPGHESVLRDTLAELCPVQDPQPVLGVVAPHAGYVYSGAVAGEVYGRIEVPDLCVVLAPNHTGCGPAFSLYPEGSWQTPLGQVPISADLNQELMVAFPELREDYSAHEGEHAAELQLPFLQFRNPGLQLAVIVVRSQHLEKLLALGAAIAEVAKVFAAPLLVVASSDMNHFEDQQTTLDKDQRALDQLLALDPSNLHRVVQREHISMCGVAPAVAMLHCSNLRGAGRAELFSHETSARVSGDTRRVVGYAALAVS